MVGLGAAIDKKPQALSGGMKQRVGIARAFAIEPKMLLLDEPFGALDALTRGTIQDELLRICAETHQTVFMITHDVDEAILLADRILLMSNGPRAGVAEIVAQHDVAPAPARDAAPRPAVLPHPQPPGRLPGRPLAASCRTVARRRSRRSSRPGSSPTRSTPRRCAQRRSPSRRPPDVASP